MAVVTISAHQVDSVTVLVPESSFVGQSTVGDGRVVVLVEGGEGPSIVVGHGVTWNGGTKGRASSVFAWFRFHGSAHSAENIWTVPCPVCT